MSILRRLQQKKEALQRLAEKGLLDKEEIEILRELKVLEPER